MSQIGNCPILQPLTGDPAVSQLQQFVSQLQQYINSPTNLVRILTGGNISNISLGYRVYLAISAGSNGDDGSTTTAAFPTYTYNLYDDSDHTILLQTNTAVLFHRPITIAVHPATIGFALKLSGIYVLLFTDEYFDQELLTFDVA